MQPSKSVLFKTIEVIEPTFENAEDDLRISPFIYMDKEAPEKSHILKPARDKPSLRRCRFSAIPKSCDGLP